MAVRKEGNKDEREDERYELRNETHSRRRTPQTRCYLKHILAGSPAPTAVETSIIIVLSSSTRD